MQQEQKYHAMEQKNFALFVECAKAATAQGLNVAPNRANFETAIDDQAQDFSVENVMAMLFRGGPALAPNATEIAKELSSARKPSVIAWPISSLTPCGVGTSRPTPGPSVMSTDVAKR